MRSAPYRCDFKCNLFQFPTLNTPLEKDPLLAVCNYQIMLLTQLSTLSQHRDLKHFPDKAGHGWLAPCPRRGHEGWSNITRKPGTSHGCVSFHLCASQLPEPATLPFPRTHAPHMCRLNFWHCPRTHTPPLTQPLLTQREGRIRGPSPGGALVYKHGQAEERKKSREWWKSAQTRRRQDVRLKNCRKTSSRPSSKKQEQ